MKVLHINNQSFQREVMESEQPVLLDFFAPWCGPCRMVSPVLDQLAEERPDIKVCKVNVDEEPALAAQFGVISIPSLFVIENGEIKNKAQGAQTKAKLMALVDQ